MKSSKYCCVIIYFADIGSFDGNEMTLPPNVPGVYPDEDQERREMHRIRPMWIDLVLMVH